MLTLRHELFCLILAFCDLWSYCVGFAHLQLAIADSVLLLPCDLGWTLPCVAWMCSPCCPVSGSRLMSWISWILDLTGHYHADLFVICCHLHFKSDWALWRVGPWTFGFCRDKVLFLWALFIGTSSTSRHLCSKNFTIISAFASAEISSQGITAELLYYWSQYKRFMFSFHTFRHS